MNGNVGRAGKRGVAYHTTRTQQPGRRSETKDGKTSPGNDGVHSSFLLPFPNGGPDSPPTASDSGTEDASPSSRAEGGSDGRGGGGGAADGGGDGGGGVCGGDGGGGGGGSGSSDSGGSSGGSCGGRSGGGGGGGCNAVLSVAAASADAAIDSDDIHAAEPPMAEGEEKIKSAAGDPDLYTDPNKAPKPQTLFHESSSGMPLSSTPASVVPPSPPPPPPPCRQTIGIVDLSLLHEWLTVLLHRTIPGAKNTKPSPGADYAARAAAAIAAIEGTTPTEGGEGGASGRGDSRSSPKQEAEEDARAHLQRRRKERQEQKLEQQRQQKESGQGKGKSGGGGSDVLHPHYLEKKEEGKAEAEEGAKKKHMSLKSVLAATQSAVSVHFASKKFLSTVQLRRITRACLEWATTPIGHILHVRLRRPIASYVVSPSICLCCRQPLL